MGPDAAAIDRGMERAISSFRLVALVGAGIGVVVERDHLVRPWLAAAALAAPALLTIHLHLARSDDRARVTELLVFEAALGCALLVIDGVVYDELRQQSLPWAWPSAAILTAAVLGGIRWGLAGAALASVAGLIGESLLHGSPQWTTTVASRSALFALAAVVAAAAADRLRQAEDEMAAVRAREEAGRVVHDGILQTLAAIARRSDDDALRTLAADTERELRSYLVAGHQDVDDLPMALRAAASEVARREAVDVRLAVADDLPELPPERRRALVGAVTEAVTNAAKHGRANRIVVFADCTPDEAGVTCSVRDDGVGFDGTTPPGRGIERSIVRRMSEVGGRAEIESTPGRGTEVRVWVG